MPRYRKKPVVVEAIQWEGPGDTNRIVNWLSMHSGSIRGWTFVDDWIEIPTLEGAMKASSGDWIIRGIKGEFYPCKPDIFAVTYEPA